MHTYYIFVEDSIIDCYTRKLHNSFGAYALDGTLKGFFRTDKELSFDEIIESWEAESGQEIWRNDSIVYIEEVK